MNRLSGREFWEKHFIPEVPEVADAYRDELASEDGELLPHVVFGAVLLPFLKAAADEAREDVLGRALGCVEMGLSAGDQELQGAILVSFLEPLAKRTEQTKMKVRSHFGPNVESAMKAVEQWLAQPYLRDKSGSYRSLRWTPRSGD